MNFNKVLLAGNLTRDPEMRTANSDLSIAAFTLAVSRKYKDKEEVAFIDCDAFGKTAETIGQHLCKGRGVFIEGRLKMDSWQDKQSGEKRSRLKVVVDNFQFIDGPGGKNKSPARNGRPPEAEEDIPF